MILHEILGGENHPVYQELEIANGIRQYDFLRSLVNVSLAVARPFLSSHIIKALNFQAITCLHTSAGEYRPCQVTVGDYVPPPHFLVQAQMDDFVNMVNRNWESTDAVALAAFVLWRLNNIHPFINGNGRTARAASYFVLCVKLQVWLPGTTILPELLKRERDRYVLALQAADKNDFSSLHQLISDLLAEQVQSVEQSASEPTAAPDAAAPTENT